MHVPFVFTRLKPKQKQRTPGRRLDISFEDVMAAVGPVLVVVLLAVFFWSVIDTSSEAEKVNQPASSEVQKK